MSTNKEASVTNVGPKRRKTRKGERRTRRICARVDEAVWNSKPKGKSWADYITHLARRGSTKGVLEFDIFRTAVWGCQLLDKLVQLMSQPPVETASQATGGQNHQLPDASRVLAEITTIRRALENL